MSSIAPAVQSVLDLFQGPLGHLRFGEVDAAGLAGLAAEVQSAALEVEAQEAKLTELRGALAQRQEALLAMAQQALAYARVYAENDEPLLEELNRISLPRAAKPRKAAARASGRDAAREEPTQEEVSSADAPGGEGGVNSAVAAQEAAGEPAEEEQPARSARRGRPRAAAAAG